MNPLAATVTVKIDESQYWRLGAIVAIGVIAGGVAVALISRLIK